MKVSASASDANSTRLREGVSSPGEKPGISASRASPVTFITDDFLLHGATARAIWSRANARLADADLSAQGILRRFQVSCVCTTDDPAEPLTHHAALAASPLDVAVYPTFRPDRALRIGDAVAFNRWVDALG